MDRFARVWGLENSPLGVMIRLVWWEDLEKSLLGCCVAVYCGKGSRSSPVALSVDGHSDGLRMLDMKNKCIVMKVAQ